MFNCAGYRSIFLYYKNKIKNLFILLIDLYFFLVFNLLIKNG
jgi:hypothetical protein